MSAGTGYQVDVPPNVFITNHVHLPMTPTKAGPPEARPDSVGDPTASGMRYRYSYKGGVGKYRDRARAHLPAVLLDERDDNWSDDRVKIDDDVPGCDEGRRPLTRG